MSSIIKGSISKGYDLNMVHARKLFEKGLIEKPTSDALKNYFVEHVLVPGLKKLKDKHVITDSPNEISGLRKFVGDITFNGEPADLKQVNKLFQKIKDNKPITQSTILDFTNPARNAAALGFNESSERMANFWDQVEVLKNKRNESILNNSHPNNTIKQNNIFENKMKSLIHKNRRWLGRNVKFDPMQPDKIGWSKDSSREGYLKWQKDVYKDSQAETRAAAQQLGIKFDAGHGLSLGGIKISPEEFKNLSAPVQRMLKEEGLEDPDVEGGYHIRGTNSASNLAIEVAKYNRSKGSLSSRNIENLLKLNVAFTKSQSLAEYNMRDSPGFRKNTDFSKAIRNLMLHSGQDISALESMGEDELLQKGIIEAPRSKVSQGNVTGELSEINPDAGPVTTTKVNEAGNPLSISKEEEAFYRRYPHARPKSEEQILNEMNRPNQVLNLASEGAKMGLRSTPVSREVMQAIETAQMINDVAAGKPEALIKTAVGVTGNALTTTEPNYSIWDRNDKLLSGAK